MKTTDTAPDTLDPCEALRRITEVLSGAEWDADTLDYIATAVRHAGYPVRGMCEEDQL